MISDKLVTNIMPDLVEKPTDSNSMVFNKDYYKAKKEVNIFLLLYF